VASHVQTNEVLLSAAPMPAWSFLATPISVDRKDTTKLFPNGEQGWSSASLSNKFDCLREANLEIVRRDTESTEIATH
jgi:hypothetical protein